MERRIGIVLAATACGLLATSCARQSSWIVMHDHAINAIENGDSETAEAYLTDALAIAESTDETPLFFEHSMAELGRVHHRAQRFDQAEGHYRQAYVVREARLGSDHIESAELLSDLASTCSAQGKHALADVIWNHVRAVQTAQYGAHSSEAGTTLFHLGSNAIEAGATGVGTDYLAQALPITDGAYGSLALTETLEGFAASKEEAGEMGVAENLYRRALAIRLGDTPLNDPLVTDLFAHLGVLNGQLGQWAQSEADLSGAMANAPRDDYAAHLWVARARQGHVAEANIALENYIGERIAFADDDWAGTVLGYLTGRYSETDLFAAAEINDTTETTLRSCEANYFAGTVALTNGDVATAEQLFLAAVQTGATVTSTFGPAVTELDHIGSSAGTMLTNVDVAETTPDF